MMFGALRNTVSSNRLLLHAVTDVELCFPMVFLRVSNGEFTTGQRVSNQRAHVVK